MLWWESLIDISGIRDTTPQTFFRTAESASQRREQAPWRPIWPAIYIPWPYSGPLVAIRGLGTEMASLHEPPSGTSLGADPVTLGEALWRHPVGCWRPEPVRQNFTRHK